jgi:hypothetical protein
LTEPDYLERLRDDFAKAALSSFSNPDLLIAMSRQAAEHDVPLPRAVARLAFEIADAMLAVRGNR